MKIQNVLPRDAIPSIDDPTFGPNHFGDQDEDVIIVEADPPRAYPVRILHYHEIVNDVLETEPSTATRGRPIAVTWCPICASAIVFERDVGSRILTFGTSGKLADDALVMYDRETESEWKQPLGRAISGPMKGTELSVIPSSLTSLKRYQSEYPDGVILQPPTEKGSDQPSSSAPSRYDTSRYEQYDADQGFGLAALRDGGAQRAWDRTDLAPKTTVLGIIRNGDAVGYPIPRVRAAGGIVTDTVGEQDVLVVSLNHRIHAFADPGYDFEIEGRTVTGDGATWDVVSGRSDDGRRLSRIPARRLYAFAWQDDHGPDSFYEPA